MVLVFDELMGSTFKLSLIAVIVEYRSKANMAQICFYSKNQFIQLFVGTGSWLVLLIVLEFVTSPSAYFSTTVRAPL
jgi:hypothetical protein